jgi:PAS domain S-box-containing protein
VTPADAGPPGRPGEAAALKDGQHYRQLVELSPDAVLLCSQNGQILYANLAGLEMLGFERASELLGRSLDSVVYPTSRQRVRARIASGETASGSLPFVEERFLRADGSAFPVEMMTFPFVHGGEFVTYLVVRDITKRKEAEARQRRLRRRAVAAASVAALAVLAVAGYNGYRYSESVEFCGLRCHAVMTQEHVQHQRSSHAHVSCAGCHIGEGASWYVKSKLAGLHQLWAVLSDSYSKPLPAPIVNLRPAPETCEHCHSSRVFHGDRQRIVRAVGSAGPDDPEVTALSLHVGGLLPATGKFSGIHWHASTDDRVEYLATDASRLIIADIRVTRADGSVTTYRSPGLPPAPEGTAWRTMDCCDCHNRVAHRFQSPEQAVDSVLLAAPMAAPLPDVRRASLAAVTGEYPSSPAAAAGILASLEGFYARAHADLTPAQRAEVKSLADRLWRQAWAGNVRPHERVGWGTYPDHDGHRGRGGCFRCHDGQHAAPDGRPVSQECGLCHEVLVQAQPQSTLSSASLGYRPVGT